MQAPIAAAPEPESLDDQPAGMPGVDPELLALGGFKVVKGRPPKGVNAKHDIPSSDGSASSTDEAAPETPRADQPTQAQPSRGKRSGKKRQSKKKSKAKQQQQQGGGPKITRNVDFVS